MDMVRRTGTSESSIKFKQVDVDISKEKKSGNVLPTNPIADGRQETKKENKSLSNRRVSSKPAENENDKAKIYRRINLTNVIKNTLKDIEGKDFAYKQQVIDLLKKSCDAENRDQHGHDLLNVLEQEFSKLDLNSQDAVFESILKNTSVPLEVCTDLAVIRVEAKFGKDWLSNDDAKSQLLTSLYEIRVNGTDFFESAANVIKCLANSDKVNLDMWMMEYLLSVAVTNYGLSSRPEEDNLDLSSLSSDVRNHLIKSGFDVDNLKKEGDIILCKAYAIQIETLKAILKDVPELKTMIEMHSNLVSMILKYNQMTAANNYFSAKCSHDVNVQEAFADVKKSLMHTMVLKELLIEGSTLRKSFDSLESMDDLEFFLKNNSEFSSDVVSGVLEEAELLTLLQVKAEMLDNLSQKGGVFDKDEGIRDSFNKIHSFRELRAWMNDNLTKLSGVLNYFSFAEMKMKLLNEILEDNDTFMNQQDLQKTFSDTNSPEELMIWTHENFMLLDLASMAAKWDGPTAGISKDTVAFMQCLSPFNIKDINEITNMPEEDRAKNTDVFLQKYHLSTDNTEVGNINFALRQHLLCTIA